jgi:hypothetical protein
MAGAEIFIFYAVSRMDLESPLFLIQLSSRGQNGQSTNLTATLHLVPAFRICGTTSYVHSSTQVWIHIGRSRPPWTSCLTLTCLTTHWILPMHTQGSRFDPQCLKLHSGCFLCSRPTLVWLVTPSHHNILSSHNLFFSVSLHLASLLHVELLLRWITPWCYRQLNLLHYLLNTTFIVVV